MRVSFSAVVTGIPWYRFKIYGGERLFWSIMSGIEFASYKSEPIRTYLLVDTQACRKWRIIFDFGKTFLVVLFSRVYDLVRIWQ